MRHRILAILVAFVLLMLVGPPVVFAAGGTYYIANGGSDSNNGTSKSTPWAHAPCMSNFTGSYSHSNGDHFIFKGGNTWTHSGSGVCLPSTGGTSGNPDYYGVDLTWYTGGSFTQPIFDDQLTDGDQGVFKVSSLSYITFDNLEIKNIYSSVNSYNYALIYAYNATNITVTNCYLHAWKSGASSDMTQHGGFFTSGADADITIAYTTITDTEYPDNGVAIQGADGNFHDLIIHDMPSGITGVSGNLYNITIYNIDTPVKSRDPNDHTNVLYYISDSNATNYIYNWNVHDTEAGEGMYIEPCFGGNSGSTTYVFNVVYTDEDYDQGGGGLISPDTEGGTGGTCGVVGLWNNTLETASTNCIRIANQSSTPFSVVYIQNNQCIQDGNGFLIDAGTVNTLHMDHNTVMTHAVAVSQGFMHSGSPDTCVIVTNVSSCGETSVTNTTVAVGLNLTSNCTGGLVPLCTSTSYGGFVSNPNARPNSAWDTSAYQFTGGGPTGPLPPTNLTGSAQ